MPKERLKKLLAELHRELEDTSLDPELADKLRQAADDFERRVAAAEASGDVPEDDDSLFDDLLAADQRFEVAHPTIAGTLRQIMTTLSSMGI